MIKFICDNCGADAVFKFNWEFIHIESEENDVDLSHSFNSGKDHACEKCKDHLMMFFATRKPWISD